MKRLIKYPIVEIDWVDSSFHNGWNNSAAMSKKHVASCRSVGFLIRENDDEVTIAQSIAHSSEELADSIAIPKCSIKNIRKRGFFNVPDD